MLTIIVIGLLTLSGLAVVCFAAYKIRAESFELSTTFLKLMSLSIKIRSPAKPPPEDARTDGLGHDETQGHQ